MRERCKYSSFIERLVKRPCLSRASFNFFLFGFLTGVPIRKIVVGHGLSPLWRSTTKARAVLWMTLAHEPDHLDHHHMRADRRIQKSSTRQNRWKRSRLRGHNSKILNCAETPAIYGENAVLLPGLARRLVPYMGLKRHPPTRRYPSSNKRCATT